MNILQDFHFAIRSLRARVGTVGFAVLTLATGMAAAIAIFCVIDAVLLRALPYPDADRLVQIRELADDGHAMAMATPNYEDLAGSSDAFEATFATTRGRAQSRAATRRSARRSITAAATSFACSGPHRNSVARSAPASTSTLP